MSKNDVSRFMSYVLRHKPEEIGLAMDQHGWVSVSALLRGMNEYNDWMVDMAQLEELVAKDQKGRHRFNEDHTRIKACQGHTIPWVKPTLSYEAPPKTLYHGTTAEAYEKIMECGVISKMKRHAVHLQENVDKAWQSAKRWHKTPIVLAIDAAAMYQEAMVFGRTENNVWCVDEVPVRFIREVLRKR